MSIRLASIHSPEVLDAARKLARTLVRGVRTARLYARGHPTVRGLAGPITDQWREATREGPIVLTLTPNAVMLEQEALYVTRKERDVLPNLLYDEGVIGLALHERVEADEVYRLLDVLGSELDASGDYATLLWEAELEHLEMMVDEGERGGEEITPEFFASEVTGAGDEDDPPAGEDYERERRTLDRALTDDGLLPPALESIVATDEDRSAAREWVARDTYLGTVRQVGLILDRLVQQGPDPAEEEALAEALQVVLAGVLASDDLDLARELLDRAHRHAHGSAEAGRAYASRISAEMARPEHLLPFLMRVETRRKLNPRRYGEFLLRLGAAGARSLATWLLRSDYPAVVSRALCFHGDATAAALTSLLRGADAGGRERIVPILLRIGTPEALRALGSEMDRLPDPERARLAEAVGQRGEPEVRAVLLRALQDENERVRRAAVEGLRPEDDARLAPVLGAVLRGRTLEGRTAEELALLFDKLGRIAGAELAAVLAQPCARIGLKARLLGLTAVQALCLRALRRVRSPEARGVVDALREQAPRLVREAL
ncbi:MAG: HEAT repeat domain-containing protein, partial [Planctomycetota bacterium]